MTKHRDVRKVVEWLRKSHPAAYPVRVRVMKLPGKGRQRVDGLSERAGRRFTIYLDDRLSQADMIEVLLHEWAHCLDWKHHRLEARRQFDHSDEWALVYGRLYREIHDLELHAKPREEPCVKST